MFKLYPEKDMLNTEIKYNESLILDDSLGFTIAYYKIYLCKQGLLFMNYYTYQTAYLFPGDYDKKIYLKDITKSIEQLTNRILKGYTGTKEVYTWRYRNKIIGKVKNYRRFANIFAKSVD